MQAVVLAAGKSKRFYPLNRDYNKSFLKIFGKTILEHTLVSIKKTGIKDVIVVVPDEDFAKENLSQDLDLNLQFVTLNEPLGMGEAVLAAKDLITNDFFVLHATHPDFHEFYDLMLQKNKGDVLLLTKKGARAGRDGVLKVDGDLVLDLTEKPSEDSENLRVVGIYLMNKNFISVLEKTPKEHYSFEKAIAQLCKGKKVFHVTTDKNTISLKYPWDLFAFKNYLFEQLESYTSPSAQISEHAITEGKLVMEDGVKILEGAVIKGKNYIGKNSLIGTNAIVRDGSVIGDNCTIGAGTEVKNTIMFDHSNIHTGYLGDSIIGENNKLAAGFVTANKRIDREEVKVEVDREKIGSGLSALGVITGSNVQAGVKVSVMPGVVIGNNVLIGPSTNVMKNIADDTKYFATFRENIEKNS